MVEVAAAAGVPTETLRKIETGRVPTPAFFTVVSIAAALEIRLTDLVGSVDRAEPEASLTDLVGSVDPAQAKPRRARTTVATAPARASA
jgi:DNA-binding Xre family transcriptional regulator